VFFFFSLMQAEKDCSPAAARKIRELSSSSIYNSQPGECDVPWVTNVDPLALPETHDVGETVFKVSTTEHSLVSKHIAMSTAALDVFDEDIYMPVQLVPRILCVGIACVDVILTVDEFPEENQKVRTSHSMMCGGGNAANTSVALSRLGFPVCLVSKRGTDLFGQQMIQDLHKDSIDTVFVSSR
jgi:hypothetical protein